MITAYDQVTDVFGRDRLEPEVLAIRLAVAYPDFSWKDLIAVVDLTAYNYHSPSTDYDRVRNSAIIGRIHCTAAGFIRGTGMFMSDNVYYNVFNIMFNTDMWDQEILACPDFFVALSGLSDRLAADARDVISARRKSSAEAYARFDGADIINANEVVLEMKDKLRDKIMLMSGA